MSERLVAFGLDDIRAVLDAHEWKPGEVEWDYSEVNACGCNEPMSVRDQATGRRKASKRDYERWLAHVEIELVRRTNPFQAPPSPEGSEQ